MSKHKYPYNDIRDQFLKDVKNHEMTILHNDGIYRHIRFGRPGSSNYYFDLVTWPGHLSISGDMGCYVFARLTDMFEFFKSDYNEDRLRVNCGYWAEKLQAPKSRDEGVYAFESSSFQDFIRNHLEEVEQDSDIAEEIIERAESVEHEHAAYEFMQEEFPEYELSDGLPDCYSYQFHFLWCLFGIVWGIFWYEQITIKEPV